MSAAIHHTPYHTIQQTPHQYRNNQPLLFFLTGCFQCLSPLLCEIPSSISDTCGAPYFSIQIKSPLGTTWDPTISSISYSTFAIILSRIHQKKWILTGKTMRCWIESVWYNSVFVEEKKEIYENYDRTNTGTRGKSVFFTAKFIANKNTWYVMGT